jgi:large subunit ribosomal protein L5
MSNLLVYYQKEVKNKLIEEFGIKNAMAAPKLKKVVINVGLGEALVNKKAVETVVSQLAVITGQKPVVTHAKKDISTFKVRKGDAIGVMVTLRGAKMYDFIEKLVKIVLPRIRDFRGISNSGFDKWGNYTLGLREQIIFTEIEYSEVDKVRGLEITCVTTAKDAKSCKRLLELLGMPFQKVV